MIKSRWVSAYVRRLFGELHPRRIDYEVLVSSGKKPVVEVEDAEVRGVVGRLPAVFAAD